MTHIHKEVLRANHITKYFHDPMTVKVLDDISFSLTQSEFVSVIGKSGCGKSTLLYILSTMDTEYEGNYSSIPSSWAIKQKKNLQQ